jgi:hypothetical protein
MAHRDSVPIIVNANVEGFDGLAARLAQSLTTINAVQRVLRDHGRIMQARAVSNASGRIVTYQGRSWVINRQTGKLVRSIQLTDPNPLAVGLVASAEYASDVEQGTRGPVDLKKTRLAGKIVPLPVKDVQGKALKFNAQGKATAPIKTLSVGRFGKQTSAKGVRANTKKATTGMVAGTKYIMFRRVPKNGNGWIIPQRPPRPFMAEAADYTAPLLKDAVEKAFAQFLTGDEA